MLNHPQEIPHPTSGGPREDADPLAWLLSAEERAVWDAFPAFRDAHPVRFASLEADP